MALWREARGRGFCCKCRGYTYRWTADFLLFLFVFMLLIPFVGDIRAIPKNSTFDDWVDNSLGSSKKNVDRQERCLARHLKALFSKETRVIDVISANTIDLGFLSLDTIKKSKLSASWTIVGNGSSDIMLTDVIREVSGVKKEDEANQHDQLKGCDDEGNCDSPEIQVRMLSREKLRKEHAAGLKIQGNIHEEAATKQSHSIEAAAMGNCKDIDDVLAASVAVNSTIKNAKGLEKHAYVATDKLNFESMDRFKCLNSSCCTVLSLQKNIASRQIIHPRRWAI